MSKQNKVLDAVMNQIIERIEKAGVLPWQRSWKLANAPMNIEYQNAYSGLNRWSTVLAGFTSPYWLTINQINKLGGKIKKGEGHTKIMKVALIEKKRKNDKGEEEVYARWTQPVRYYKMWNLEQTEGVEAPVDKAEEAFEPIEACEGVVDGYINAPELKFNGTSPTYNKDKDLICMPKKGSFTTPEDFYNTLFHEFAHSTGHSDRLNRRTLVELESYGSETYSKEELVAELASSMLCGHCGVEQKTIDNSASYISGWLDKLKANPRMLMASARMAEKAFDHIVKD